MDNYRTKGSRVFSGRDRGYSLRKKLKLDEVDCAKENIEIIIPEDIISLNSSFFLGLFGKSVRTLGRSEFRSKYNFVCNEFIKKNIYDAIERALKIKVS